MEMLIDFEDCHIDDLYDKIDEIINYINKKENKTTEPLYVIKDLKTGEIIFNVRGGAY